MADSFASRWSDADRAPKRDLKLGSTRTDFGVGASSGEAESGTEGKSSDKEAVASIEGAAELVDRIVESGSLTAGLLEGVGAIASCSS